MRRMSRSAAVKGSAVASALLGLLVVAGLRPSIAEGNGPAMGDLESAVKGRWVGKPESSLIERMGPPNEDTNHDGGHYLEWDASVGFGGDPNRFLTCKAEMRFETSKLTAVRLEGNDHNLCHKLIYPLVSEPQQKK